MLGYLLAAVRARKSRRSLGPKREAGPRTPPHTHTEELCGKGLQGNAEKVKFAEPQLSVSGCHEQQKGPFHVVWPRTPGLLRSGIQAQKGLHTIMGLTICP